MKYITSISAIVFSLIFPAIAVALTAEAQTQIAHLLAFVSTSSCQFMRNGKWYEARDAAEHISRKYSYVLGKGLVASPEDFIHYAATKSSMTGKNYRVKCGAEPEIDSSEWLRAELDAYRASQQ